MHLPIRVVLVMAVRVRRLGAILAVLSLACCGRAGPIANDSVDAPGPIELVTTDFEAPGEDASFETDGTSPPDVVAPDLGRDAADLAPPPDAAADLPDASADLPAAADVPLDVPVDPPDAADAPFDAPPESGEIGGEVVDPWPVPDLDPEPPAACPATRTDPSNFQFLDDLCHQKVWPSHVDRDVACPVVDASAQIVRADGSTVSFAEASAPVVVDAQALAGLALPAGLKVVLIEIVRVNGVPHFRYVSNGTESQAVQPWSSTKFLAVANAAARLRIASDYTVGLTARVGGQPVGDYVTSIHTYDHAPYSSNSLAAWFHDVGLHQRANDLVHDLWLHRPDSETFGGNYGEAPAPLPFVFVEAGGASVTLTPDPGSGAANHLSVFTLAEALKRLVLHREVALQRLPGIQWLDVKTLLYGAEGSATYGEWGGMSADTAIYLQSGHDPAYLEARSQGRWRIFSKLGLGSAGQFVNVGYACWPVLDAAGVPVPGRGRELVLAAVLDQGGSSWAARDRLLARAYRAIVTRVVKEWL